MEIKRSILLATLTFCALTGKSVWLCSAQTHPPSGKTRATSAQQRHHFLQMFARSDFPGKTGHLSVVPGEGFFVTRADPNVSYMHGSPWWYDVSIPLMF